jgi:hypothetical protein
MAANDQPPATQQDTQRPGSHLGTASSGLRMTDPEVCVTRKKKKAALRVDTEDTDTAVYRNQSNRYPRTQPSASRHQYSPHSSATPTCTIAIGLDVQHQTSLRGRPSPVVGEPAQVPEPS